MLRIAVQAKGRLFEETMALLGEPVIKFSTTKRTLLVQSSKFPIEVLFLRDDDIPQTVATGVADLGIVGEKEFMEKEEDAEIIKRLGFSKCRLSLAMPKDIEYPGLSWFNGKKIATSYPVILRNFLKKNGVNAEIHVITGSVEVSPGIGLADAIFDIVSSGSTLVSNRLKEVEVVMKSEALLIGNKNMSDEKKEVLEELLFRMNAVKTAEDKKYVLMNAPKDKLEEIIAVLPGMKSPTVMPLAQEGWCSVHTVLDEKRFWEIIGKLKSLKSNLDYGMFLPVQKGAIKALTQDQSCVEKTRNAYKHRRDLLVNGCKSIGWDIDMPKGTMFVWAKIPDKFKDSETFVKELFDKTGVLVVPGNAFGTQGEGYVRMALVQSDDTIEHALDMMDKSGLFK